ncbi:hypothetical protein [Streptosporangium sp. OZ121]|uniref:hypothetical protein n=1 Tax=Streptosporangium sp. OZ121 TaxID=3444183 RepID=UPI003F7AE20C
MLRPPLYLTPPSTEPIRAEMRAGRLGAIITPAQGNRIPAEGMVGIDNGVFTGKYPGRKKFLEWLRQLRDKFDVEKRCLFVAAPDVVGNAYETELLARPMLEEIRKLGFPAGLVAQDHMELSAWDPWDEADCLFVGGSTAWKLSPAAANICRVASSLWKHIHVGRVNSLFRYRHAAHLMDADSVDGTYLTKAPDKNLPKVLSWRKKVFTSSAFFGHRLLTSDPWDGGYVLVPPREATQLDLFDALS